MGTTNKFFWRFWSDGRVTVAVDPVSKDATEYRLAFSFCNYFYDTPNKEHGKAAATGRLVLDNCFTLSKADVEQYKGIYNALCVHAATVRKGFAAAPSVQQIPVPNDVAYDKTVAYFRTWHFPAYFTRMLLKDSRNV